VTSAEATTGNANGAAESAPATARAAARARDAILDEHVDPPFEFLDRFPEGTYRFERRTTEHVRIVGEAEFTHAIPAGPVIVSPVSGNEEPPVVDPADFTIEREPVTETYFGEPEIEIVSYELTIEQEEPLRTLKVLLPPSRTSFRVPEDFFEQSGTEHKFEILAKEASGNQTITEGEFVTID
jgi:hypothetical protein